MDDHICDATMYHMRTATVRDLRYRFPEVETLLRDGEEVQITKRKRVIARLVPVSSAVCAKRPDFLARLKRIYGDTVLKVSGAELLAQERDRF
jgi:antitoxin (DNA-binding transcriptional repressor) of toxin-antitoxin stability system